MCNNQLPPPSSARGGGFEANGGNGSGSRVQQQEEERLRNWIQEMRHERRRLEDKLLMGDTHVSCCGYGMLLLRLVFCMPDCALVYPCLAPPQGLRALDMRDDLEKQVLGLARQRDVMESEMASMTSMQQSVQDLAGEVWNPPLSLQCGIESWAVMGSNDKCH